MGGAARGPSVRAGDTVELDVSDLAYGGAGVGRAEGLAVFVQGALPGDRARVRILTRKPNYAEAEVLELLRPSDLRIQARCVHFGACGGCQWMNLAYEAQIGYKERQIAEALARLGKLRSSTLHPIVRSPEAFGYRNRMEFTFGMGPNGLFAGLHRADDPSRLEPILECHLQSPEAGAILQWVVARCGKALSSAPSTEFFRRVTIRRGSPGAAHLVVLTTRQGSFPEGPRLGREMMSSLAQVAGVVRRIVDDRGFEVSVRKLAGVASLREQVAGLTLSLTACAFLQVNTAVAERLYGRVEDLARIEPHETILDLYCGVGAIALLLGRAGARATGVEASGESVRCAEENAAANKLEQCRFLLGDARRVAISMAAAGERYDAIVVNPPRAGLPADLIGAVSRLSATRIVYVSCNPATLARDLARFEARGYVTTDVAPFDMFPHTYHVETVARLQREG